MGEAGFLCLSLGIEPLCITLFLLQDASKGPTIDRQGPLDASGCQLDWSDWAEEGHPVLQLQWMTLYREGNVFYGDRQDTHSEFKLR